jgi:regulator of RNase E activity RraB
MGSLLAHQRRLVDQLTARSVRCRFVGSMLYGGMFDLVFQVEAQESGRFKTAVAEWAGTALPCRVEVKQSSGWDFFDAKVRPSPAHAQQIADRRVIQGLIDAGSDPAIPHQLDHRIEGPPEVLRQIARDLEANGFVRARFPAEDVLLINTESPLDLMEIWDTTGRLVGYCANCGARYDGWGAAVVRPGE